MPIHRPRVQPLTRGTEADVLTALLALAVCRGAPVLPILCRLREGELAFNAPAPISPPSLELSPAPPSSSLLALLSFGFP